MKKNKADDINLSDAYRSARNKISLFCGIALAWATAQFEITKVSLGGLGDLDLSGASIPLLLSLCILYSFTRCTSEYAMQNKEIRRWHLAHFDYKLTLNIVRGSLLMLAASVLSRSLYTAGFIIIIAVILIVIGVLFVGIGTIALTPLSMFIRKKQGKQSKSVIPNIAEAEGISTFVLSSLVTAFFVYIASSPPEISLLRNLFTTTPNSTPIWILSVAGIMVFISFIIERKYTNKLFALVEINHETGVTTVYSPKGNQPFSYQEVRPPNEESS